MALWSINKKITLTIDIYDIKVRILQNELKVENVQLRIWASSNLKISDFYFKLNYFYLSQVTGRVIQNPKSGVVYLD